MSSDPSTSGAKERAAAAALPLVTDGMTLGLGTGSTASAFVRLLGDEVRKGLDIRAVATSEETERLARQVGIDIIVPDESTVIDLAVDGTDEADADGALIKGGGGALLREKIVADAARRFVVIADGSKKVRRLGAFPLPIEITTFGYGLTVAALRQVLSAHGFPGVDLTLRAGGDGFFRTDGGNYILDASLRNIDQPGTIDAALTEVPGVVTTGLFVGMADRLIFAHQNDVETIDVR